MDLATLARWEWMLILVIVLGLAIAELVSLHRWERRDRARRRDAADRPARDR